MYVHTPSMVYYPTQEIKILWNKISLGSSSMLPLIGIPVLQRLKQHDPFQNVELEYQERF